MTIDRNSLPESALFDTSALVGALSIRTQDLADVRNAELFSAMVTSRKRIFIAAPSLVELLRGSGGKEPPRVASIQIVPFGATAARICAKLFPKEVLAAERGERTQAAVKFDALIVAIAVAQHASVFVTKDEQQARSAARAGLSVKTWKDFWIEPLPLLARMEAARDRAQHSDNETQANADDLAPEQAVTLPVACGDVTASAPSPSSGTVLPEPLALPESVVQVVSTMPSTNPIASATEVTQAAGVARPTEVSRVGTTAALDDQGDDAGEDTEHASGPATS